MRRAHAVFLSLALLALTMSSAQAAQTFRSGPEATSLVELYTSEGCSSCPPADDWLSSLRQQPGLFKSFIPVAFHVDYWNNLGWTDRFARALYSDRQRQQAAQGQTSQVYTPGFIINNHEWRSWFGGARQWQASQEHPGVLEASLSGQQLDVHFEHGAAGQQLNLAYLGNGLSSKVQSGENSGRTLQHDFVVLDWQQFASNKTDAGHWQLTLPPVPRLGQQQTALVMWVSPANSLKAIQATGGYLQE
ncbi:hypothetical protein WH50_00560 [Pokkaliibacter plantistimulans]|uniref:DUF1223 domain-containing protein n=1 Tax=Pokkaliibacter plantistimulans TaxID=1635171 RepID=A0ABX5M3U0_9GAMM|nr:DUF1223 domain-containing protein [Pokkaliibacter plantistimulans]PXF33059.1 hypothetical protein WH50_00560 [Pokkaliibacter plantistimulans]